VPVPEVQVNAGRQKVVLWRWSLAVLLLCVAIAGVRASMTGKAGEASDDTHAAGESTGAKAEPSEDRLTDESLKTTKYFAVSIRKPSGPPRVATGLTDLHGSEVTVSCSTCHSTRQSNHQNKTAKDLGEFHGELKFSHGTISCLSCHNEGDYDALKLADGTRVEFTDVMTLCAQCHGPQMKDYQHGVHGGMNGYWDLTRGPRVKNNCIDCHKPHAPQFPKMQPTFKPKDRFLDQPRTEH
jgi:nitrate reductase cytochrome c-type subunit